MTSPIQRHRHTYRDYLEHDDASNTKHEFLGGEIYAMEPGSGPNAAPATRRSSMA